MLEHYNRPTRIDRMFAFVERLGESDAFIVKLVVLLFVVSLLWWMTELSLGFRALVPSDGGTFREGIVGTPRFVNPVLAVTRADKDVSALIYDGLMTLGRDGTLVPNVAESVTVSEDGLTYNVLIRKDVRFHDGTPLTALDVVYTVNRIKDPLLTSPLRASFDGIRVEQVGEYEVNFVLPKPYAPFLETLTFGIIPEHVWSDLSPEEFPFSGRNSDPIGSGPYRVAKITRSPSGIPQVYTLARNESYHRGVPSIETFTLTFFSEESALTRAFTENRIDAVAGIDPSRIYGLHIDPTTHTVMTIPQPRTFALFINQNKSSALRDIGARKALETAISREDLVKTVLGGYARPLSGPLPEGFGIPPYNGSTTESSDRADRARAILTGSGWKLNDESGAWEKNIDGTKTALTFSVSTVNNPIFEATAEFLRSEWEKIGVQVTVKQFEQSDFTQGVIRPRDYETLLFGTQLNRSLDYYSFWHSEGRNDPGLNVALYANITTDKDLEIARSATAVTARNEALTRFAGEMMKDIPAIFLYQPELLYVFPNRVKNASFLGVGESYERFASVNDWYMETESIWKFLTPYVEKH